MAPEGAIKYHHFPCPHMYSHSHSSSQSHKRKLLAHISTMAPIGIFLQPLKSRSPDSWPHLVCLQCPRAEHTLCVDKNQIMGLFLEEVTQTNVGCCFWMTPLSLLCQSYSFLFWRVVQLPGLHPTH